MSAAYSADVGEVVAPAPSGQPDRTETPTFCTSGSQDGSISGGHQTQLSSQSNSLNNAAHSSQHSQQTLPQPHFYQQRHHHPSTQMQQGFLFSHHQYFQYFQHPLNPPDLRHVAFANSANGPMPRFVAIPAFGHFGPPVGVNFGQHEKQPSPQSQSVGTSSDCSSDGTRPATAFSPAMTAASFAPLSFQSDGSPSPNPTAHVMLLVQHPPSSRSVSGASVQQAPHQQAPHCAQTNSNLTAEDGDPDVLEAAAILMKVKGPVPRSQRLRKSKKSKKLKIDVPDELPSPKSTSSRVYLTPISSPKSSGQQPSRPTKSCHEVSEPTPIGAASSSKPSSDFRLADSGPPKEADARSIFKQFLTNEAAARKHPRFLYDDADDDSDIDDDDEVYFDDYLRSSATNPNLKNACSFLNQSEYFVTGCATPVPSVDESSPTALCDIKPQAQRARKVSSSSSSSSRRRKSSSDNLECHHDSEDSPGSRSAIVKCSEKKEKLPVLPKEVDMKWYADTSRAQPITWSKGGPMTFPPETPCIELLTEEEVTLCRTLRLFPIQYLKIKETVIAATYTRAPFRKKEVRMWFPIDVNKINKLYDWFLDLNWIPQRDEDWISRETWYREHTTQSAGDPEGS